MIKTLQAYLSGGAALTMGQVYDEFGKHVCKASQQLLSKFIVGLDFNVNNMSAVMYVRLDNKLVVIDEVSGSKDKRTSSRDSKI